MLLVIIQGPREETNIRKKKSNCLHSKLARLEIVNTTRANLPYCRVKISQPARALAYGLNATYTKYK